MRASAAHPALTDRANLCRTYGAEPPKRKTTSQSSDARPIRLDRLAEGIKAP